MDQGTCVSAGRLNACFADAEICSAMVFGRDAKGAFFCDCGYRGRKKEDGMGEY